MPELPEVETLKRAVTPLVLDRQVLEIKFHRKDLRFPIPCITLHKELTGTTIRELSRVGKYLLLHNERGAMIWHLGMSGRVVQKASMQPEEKHTHAVFRFAPDACLHFIDPRRFGGILWMKQGEGHPLLDSLGPDPLSSETTAKMLKESARRCKGPIKGFLMNAKRLAGVGNIYACESLFAAGIHPLRAACKVTLPQWEKLLAELRRVLKKSIAAGGTTLRDFFSADGNPGYFAIDLSVYGKEGEPCPNCNTPIIRKVHTARSTFFCKVCQRR